MSDNLISELKQGVLKVHLNRLECHNAFDDTLLQELLQIVQEAEGNDEIKVILLQAKGKHFCAGADLNWMKRMAGFSEEENYQDSLLLARTVAAFRDINKPTIAVVQGCAYGGGAGLVAACDIAIAEEEAKFCFSEVRLGLIPAVISPFVIDAIGTRAAKHLFITAEAFDAQKALHLGLIQYCVPRAELYLMAEAIANQITQLAPRAVQNCKTLVHDVAGKPINAALQKYTAQRIAQTRVSEEGQKGLHAFLNKTPIDWTQE
jgi:methylglutaconyl-CoA hydratase